MAGLESATFGFEVLDSIPSQKPPAEPKTRFYICLAKYQFGAGWRSFALIGAASCSFAQRFTQRFFAG